LLNNAVQSIEEQGKIYIKTMLDDAWISIKITDTGIGMHEDIIHRITEPFFTTKEPGEGTGLGLSITYNIVHEHKGKMEFSSSPGKGTTVSLALPV
jgi:signal transduction histidine kinase